MEHIKQKITNPLTLIAIFATLSETSAAVSLPFLDDEDRDIYVWFLISFPFYLLFLFFATLNFNYRSLYAPSDFENGEHFIKAMSKTEHPGKRESRTTHKNPARRQSTIDRGSTPPPRLRTGPTWDGSTGRAGALRPPAGAPQRPVHRRYSRDEPTHRDGRLAGKYSTRTGESCTCHRVHHLQ